MLVIKQYRIARHHSDNMELISQKGENHKSHKGSIYHLDEYWVMVQNPRDVWKRGKLEKCRILGMWPVHVMNNDIEITGSHDHVPNPAKIGMKQSLPEVRWRPSQSRDTPYLILQEIQATLSEETLAKVSFYSSDQQMIQRKR